MLSPKKQKHRKWQKRGIKGKATSKTYLSFGSYGLKSLETARVSSRQIEAARRTMTRYVKRTGKIWIRIFPDRPITKRTEQKTQGGGKGPVDHYVAIVKPGTILFEIDGISAEQSIEVMRLAGHKLPVKTKFIQK